MRLLAPPAIAAYLALAVYALLLAASAPASARIIAIADQNPAMFSDPLWRSLGVRHARVAAAWDIATGVPDGRTVAWLDKARAAEVEVLVSWTPSEGDRLPTRAAFRKAFVAFRDRWPNVREFATWNEPNLRGQPAEKHPGLLAGYWRAMRAVCPGCIVLAPELVDFPSAPGWARRFERAVGRHGITWGLHNYRDSNRFHTLDRSVTAQMLRAVSGPIWLTEAGGIVRFAKGFACNERRAQRAVRHMFALADLSRSRIRRTYIYQWRGPRGRNAIWDSGLLAANGHPRPAFWTVAAHLGVTRSARAVLAKAHRQRTARCPH